MGYLDKETLIVVPVFTLEGEDTEELVSRIHKLGGVGQVVVVSQGQRLDLEEQPGFVVYHFDEPLGIWGALYEAFNRIRSQVRSGSLLEFRHVVYNLAPLYFSAETIEGLIAAMEEKKADHMVGVRVDIAGTLGPDTLEGRATGRARALLECFLTALASFQTFGLMRLEDGFTGLHAFSPERYFASRWEWVDCTTWGGALENQIQSLCGRWVLASCYVPHTAPRSWESTTFGAGKGAVVGMLDKARLLPVLAKPRPSWVEWALKVLPNAYERQPWFDPATAAEEVRELLRFYNTTSSLGQYVEV